MLPRSPKLMSHYLVFLSLCVGIRTKKPERTTEELHKVTEMVKNKNYNHPEIGIIR